MKYLKDFVDRERVVLFGLFLFGSFIGLLTLPCWLPWLSRTFQRGRHLTVSPFLFVFLKEEPMKYVTYTCIVLFIYVLISLEIMIFPFFFDENSMIQFIILMTGGIFALSAIGLALFLKILIKDWKWKESTKYGYERLFYKGSSWMLCSI